MRAAIPFPMSGFTHPAQLLGGTCFVICGLIIWICILSAVNPVAATWPWPLQSVKEYWQAMNVLARDDLGFGFVFDKTFGIPLKPVASTALAFTYSGLASAVGRFVYLQTSMSNS